MAGTEGRKEVEGNRAGMWLQVGRGASIRVLVGRHNSSSVEERGDLYDDGEPLGKKESAEGTSRK